MGTMTFEQRPAGVEALTKMEDIPAYVRREILFPGCRMFLARVEGGLLESPP